MRYHAMSDVWIDFLMPELGKAHLFPPASIISSDQTHSQWFIYFWHRNWVTIIKGQTEGSVGKAAKTQDLSSILRTHTVEKDTQFLDVVLQPLHVFWDTHTSTLNKVKRNNCYLLYLSSSTHTNSWNDPGTLFYESKGKILSSQWSFLMVVWDKAFLYRQG